MNDVSKTLIPWLYEQTIFIILNVFLLPLFRETLRIYLDVGRTKYK